jgi:hypothetical protein
MTRIRHFAMRSAGAAVSAVLASCTASLSEGARDKFAGMTSCPAESTTAVARPGYRRPSHSDVVPPEEADPGRLSYWQQRRTPMQPDRQDEDCEFFEVTGCGQRQIFCCRHPVARDGAGVQTVRTGTAECEER